MAWLYLPDMGGSNSESMPPSEVEYEPYVTLKGKVTRRPLSWHAWKRRPWIQLLCGMMLPPSTADLGAARWISSLRDSLASPSPPSGNSAAPATSAGSGMTSSESFARFSPDGSLVKTSRDLFGSDLKPYSDRLPKWGMMLSGELFEQTKWELPTDASECSSSLGWPTITASEARKEAGRANPKDRVLNEEAKVWPGNVPPWVECPDCEDHYCTIHGTHAYDCECPPVDQWAEETGRMPYEAMGHANWPTPDANCWKGGTGKGTRGTGRDGQLDDTSSLLVLPPSTCGPECSPKHRRLNPHFVEWLMGLPRCWTVAKIGSGPSVTALFHYKRLLRSACSQIVRAGNSTD